MPAFHPDLRSLAPWLPRGVGVPWLVRLLRRLPIPSTRLPAGITVRESPIADGHPARVRVLRPAGDKARRPAILWIHGGGFVIGAAKQDDGVCARLAQRLDAVVVSVDYRLAPDHPFPTPLEDCAAAWEFVLREADALGINPAQIIVAGQSAGAGLAAGLCLLLHDRQRPPPLLQVLIYPMLDDRTTLRVIDGQHHRLWNAASNAFGWRAYLGVAPGSPGVSDHAAPARRENLAGLPPAWIGVGTLDLFHDEDVAYAARLREAGVPTTLEIVDGAFHGFDAAAPKKPVSVRFFDAQVAAIEEALRRADETRP